MAGESPIERARALSLRVLSFHARTEQQLRRRLEKAGLGSEADAVVAWLLRLGYLDDEAWAGAVARSLLRPGRFGPRAAERRLCAAGIPGPKARAAVEEAMAEGRAGGEPPEVALCRALAERRARGARPADLPDRERARLARFLLGRGFGAEAVHRVVGGPEWDG